MTTCPSPMRRWILRHDGARRGDFSGRPVLTLQKPHALVQVSPRIMMVAVPRFQHSPMFGQAASLHRAIHACRRFHGVAHSQAAGHRARASRVCTRWSCWVWLLLPMPLRATWTTPVLGGVSSRGWDGGPMFDLGQICSRWGILPPQNL